MIYNVRVYQAVVLADNFLRRVSRILWDQLKVVSGHDCYVHLIKLLVHLALEFTCRRCYWACLDRRTTGQKIGKGVGPDGGG